MVRYFWRASGAGVVAGEHDDVGVRAELLSKDRVRDGDAWERGVVVRHVRSVCIQHARSLGRGLHRLLKTVNKKQTMYQSSQREN